MGFDPLSSLLDVAKTVLDKVLPDPKQKAEALLKLEELRQSGDLAVIAAQTDVNKIEAANPNLFVSAWRPSVGWVCSAALAFQLVIGPMIVWGTELAGHPVHPPIMQTELLTTLLVGMLGLGGMRTVEKLNGVASK
jgi:hypothetical protein